VDAFVAELDTTPTPSSVELQPFDHIHPSSRDTAAIAVLYVEPGTEHFSAFHNALLSASQSARVKYLLRPFTASRTDPVFVQGYGVELAIKSLEYKVMDAPAQAEEESDIMVVTDESDEDDVQGFLFGTLSKRYPSLSSALNQLRESLLSSDDTVDNLSKWEFGDLGIQAMQHIIDSEDPFRALRDVSQNLPSLAPLLSKLKRSSATVQLLQENAKMLEEGSNVVLINGQPIDADADIFALFSLLRRQINKYESLRKLDLARSSVFDLLALPNPQRITPRIQLNSDYVVWLNNLESDSMYRAWPGSVRDILRPTFPNQLHFIGKNIFNLLCVVDLTDDQYVEWVNNMLALIYRNQAPLRFGFLPLVPGSIKDLSSSEIEGQPLGLAVAKVLLHFTRDHDLRATTTLLQHFVGQPRVTSLERLREVFDVASGSDWEEVIGNKFNVDLRSIQSLLEDAGIAQPIALLNGFVLDIPSPNQFTNQVANELFRQRRDIQDWVLRGLITDNMDIYDWLLQQDGFPSYNPAIFPSSQSPERYLSLSEPSTRFLLQRAPYITAPGTEDSTKKFTHVLLVDYQNPSHIQMVKDVMQRVLEGTESRFTVFGCGADNDRLSRVLAALHAVYQRESSSYVHERAVQLFQEAVTSWNDAGLSPESIMAFIKANEPSIDIEKFSAVFDAPETSRVVEKQMQFCKLANPDRAGASIVTNGRVFTSVKPFGETELSTIESYETKSRLQAVATALSAVSFDGVDFSSVGPEQMSNLMQFVAAAVSREVAGDVQRPTINPDIQPYAYPFGFPPTAGLTVRALFCRSFESRNLDSAVSIFAVLDPLSSAAQRISSTLSFLREYLDPDTRVVLSPRTTVSDLPLKNFFRMKLDPITFDADGKRARKTESLRFAGLPQRKLLTMNMQPPAPWLVEATSCKYDLDNILLSQLPPHEASLSVTFELNHILVEGSCNDDTNGGVPPRGLQLILGDALHPDRVDTLVMSNLGYFQLKASPGVWTLKLADGRADDIYRIKSADGRKKIVLSDWIPQSHVLSVEKKPEKIHEPLFPEGESEDDSGILGGMLGGIFGKKGTTKDAGETINVFSLASGHLYERFLKIMMLSVVKKTDRPVKFWLLKNFLSPAFKEFIPRP
jgi:UDP-glucose:glycoprotein glucosyltransferase